MKRRDMRNAHLVRPEIVVDSAADTGQYLVDWLLKEVSVPLVDEVLFDEVLKAEEDDLVSIGAARTAWS